MNLGLVRHGVSAAWLQLRPVRAQYGKGVGDESVKGVAARSSARRALRAPGDGHRASEEIGGLGDTQSAVRRVTRDQRTVRHRHVGEGADKVMGSVGATRVDTRMRALRTMAGYRFPVADLTGRGRRPLLGSCAIGGPVHQGAMSCGTLSRTSGTCVPRLAADDRERCREASQRTTCRWARAAHVLQVANLR